MISLDIYYHSLRRELRSMAPLVATEPEPVAMPVHGSSDAASLLRDILSGAFGSICLVAAGAPADLVKVRLQTDSAPRGLVRTITDIARGPDGLRGLWRGALPALASALTENVVLFATNGFLRRAVGAQQNDRLSIMQHTLLGAVSGIFSATAICPAEVVKIRMQSAAATSVGGVRGVAALQLVVRQLAAEGVGGFTRGLVPLLLRDVPYNGITFGAYHALLEASNGARGTGVGGDGTPPPPEAWRACLAGGAASALAWTVILPFDALKSRAQAAAGPGAVSPLAALRAAIAVGGVRVLYRGWTAVVVRAYVANAALFGGVAAAERALLDARLV